MTVPTDFRNCSSGCQEGGHATYGECLRAKRCRVSSPDQLASHNEDQKMHRGHAAYADALKEGLKPDAPTQAAVDSARRKADILGKA